MADSEICYSVVTKWGPKWREERRVRIETREREVESSISEVENREDKDIEKDQDVSVSSTLGSG